MKTKIETVKTDYSTDVWTVYQVALLYIIILVVYVSRNVFITQGNT